MVFALFLLPEVEFQNINSQLHMDQFETVMNQ